MKVCIIVDDYMPRSTKVTAKMMHELSVEFIKQGNEVTVVTPDSTLKSNHKITLWDGVTVCRFSSGDIKNISKVKRLLNEYMLSCNAWKAYKSYFKDNHHDLIVFWSPSIFWSGLISNLKSLWDAPSYMLLRDFFPQWAIDSGIIKEQSLITKFFRYYENKNYQSADMIALQSPKNIEWFSSRNIIDRPVDLLYNWATDKPIKDIGSDYRKALGLEDKVVFFYGGNIGHAQDMMNIVRLAKSMEKEKNAHFVLIGKGDEFDIVQRAVLNNDLNNLTLFPAVSQEEFKAVLAEFDIGLFSLHRDHVTHNFPGKLLAYMVQGIPILGSINTGNDLKEVIEKAGAGLVTINGEDDKLLDNARMLLDNKKRRTMGQNSKQLLHDVFSVETAVNTITNFYNGQKETAHI